jgi:hypothetical protein
MTDPEIEDLLRRYRPTGPSADLRARIVAGNQVTGRAWPWAAAAAVLLGAVCATQLWTQSVYEDVRNSVAPTHSSIMSDLPALQSAVDEDPLLRERIERLVRQEASQSPPPRADAGASWQ